MRYRHTVQSNTCTRKLNGGYLSTLPYYMLPTGVIVLFTTYYVLRIFCL